MKVVDLDIKIDPTKCDSSECGGVVEVGGGAVAASFFVWV